MTSSIGIAARVFDTGGTLFVQRPSADCMERNRRGSRRVSRTKTLDGGCAYYDTGYADADRNIVAEIENATQAEIDRAAYLVETYGEVTVCCSEGAFICVPDSYNLDEGKLTITFMIMERIDE